MSISLTQVYAKAKAFVDSLGKLPPDQYAAVPTGQYGREYSMLRSLALQVQPSIDLRLLGPNVTVSPLADGREVCEASFAEIETYARQIMEQLALLLHAPSTPPDSHASSPAADDAPAKVYCVGEIRKQHPDAYARWTEDDDAGLTMRFGDGATIDELAEEFGRQRGGIRSRLKKLGLISQPE